MSKKNNTTQEKNLKMKTQYKKGLLLIALGILSTTEESLHAEKNAWEIEPRKLPPSLGVSEIFRESLANTSTPDIAPALVVPKTDADWIALAKERDAKSVVAARALAEATGVRVEEEEIGGVKVFRVSPPEADEFHQKHLFVYIHGGAWFLNGGLAGTIEPVVIAARLKIPVVSIDYRMPPQFPAPAATDDVIAVWKELLKERRAGSMVMGGTSAGGNITLSSIHEFKKLGLPVPAALYIGTPSVDLNMTGDSRFLNEGVDRILLTFRGLGQAAAERYAGKLDLNDPRVSPIYGDFSGFPPSYLISGTRDLVLSDTVRAHRALRRAGVEADLHVYEGQSHGDYIYVINAPESAEHYEELNRFVMQHLSSPLDSDAETPEELEQVVIPKSAVE